VPSTTSNGGVTWDPVSGQALAINDQTQLWYQSPAGTKVVKLGYKGARTGTWTNFEAPTLYATDSLDTVGASTRRRSRSTTRCARPRWRLSARR
jgi:hypothetical protein